MPVTVGGKSGVWRAVLVGLGVLVAIPLLGRGCGSCMGYQDVVMKRINDCPRATELLGAPIDQSLVGLSCGSARSGGGSGRANWTVSVSGPKGRGRYSFNVVQNGGPWRIRRASLEAKGQTVDVLHCAVMAGGGGDVSRSFRGVVTSATGTGAPAAAGAPCTVTVRPSDGDHPCRTEVACGGVKLYGVTSSTGYSSCHLEPGPNGRDALVVQDQDFTPQGGDPALDLREAAGTLVVSDQLATGMWTVGIKLETAASATQAAPAK